MEPAPLTVPAGSCPRASERTAAPRPIRGGRARPWWLLPAAALVLWRGGSLPVKAAEAYLPSVGPAFLRFAPAPATHFNWPAAPPALLAAAPSPPQETNSVSVSSTNDTFALPTLEEFLQNTNRSPDLVLEAASSPPVEAPPPTDLVGTPLSASELLVVTPQMLAEYFKNASGGTNLPPTSFIPGDELYFHPPVAAPAPESRAVYRVQ